MRALVIFGLAAAIAGVSRAAGASEGSAAAEALFRDGREAAKRGDAATACARFAESQRLDPAAGTLLNIAECEEKLGRIASAWAHLREALDTLPASDDRVEAAMKHVAALEPRLPRLVVRLAPAAPASTRVERDGSEIGTGSLGLPIPVDPGSHRVLVKAAGRAPRAYTVEAVEGKRIVVVVEPAAEPEQAPPTQPHAPKREGNPRTLGYVLLGSGAVAFGAGAVTGLLAIGRKSFMDDHCDAARVCDQDGLDAGHAGRTFDVVSTVSFIAAGALVAGGIAWIVTHPSREAE